MTQSNISDPPEASPQDSSQDSSFADILTDFEQTHKSRGETVDGTVVMITTDGIYVDIGRKMDGVLPPDPRIKKGDRVVVSIRGRDEEGNYTLSTIKVETPRDWTALEAAFEGKRTIGGMVTEVVKGGLRVDVGLRAFMPASRSGVREQAEMEKLVGQQIECRITKLDKENEDLVVDRRVVLEEREKITKEEAFGRITEGAVLQGTVRSLMDFGAFVDLGGVDGLLHVSDMSFARNVKPSDVVSVGDSIDVKVLKVSPETRKIALGMKQLLPDPWIGAAAKYVQGERVKGKVSRVADFGAFVELEPGIEGLIHVSEMSWSKKNVRAADILKIGEMVEAVVLTINPADRRIGLGLKQTLGDPWAEALKKYPVGSVAEGPVTSMAKFGAFIDLGDGIEGMIHIGDISADKEKRLGHPNEVLKMGEKVRAQVLEADKDRRRLRLGIKQLVPTSIDEYIGESKAGDTVSGRIVSVSGDRAKVELGEGVFGSCKLPATAEKANAEAAGTAKADLSTLSSMLSAKWKSGGASEAAAEPLKAGQIRSFKISNVDPSNKRIELELL